MRRRLATLLVVLALVLVPAQLVGGPAALAQSGGSTETTIDDRVPTQDIIPEPNSGAEPRDAGDRGGALQTVLFLGLVGAIALGGALVIRQSRRARAERGF